MSDGSILLNKCITELQTCQEFQVIAKPLEIAHIRYIRRLHLWPLSSRPVRCLVGIRFKIGNQVSACRRSRWPIDPDGHDGSFKILRVRNSSIIMA